MFSSMANVTVGHTHFLSIQLPTECVQTGEHIVEPCTGCDTGGWGGLPSTHVCVCVKGSISVCVSGEGHTLSVHSVGTVINVSVVINMTLSCSRHLNGS